MPPTRTVSAVHFFINTMKKNKTKKALPNIKNKVMANFIANSPSDKKDTLTSYCKLHHINRGNAFKALVGTWSGKEAKALRLKLLKASKNKG